MCKSGSFSPQRMASALFKKKNLNAGCNTGTGLAYEEGGLCSLFMRHPVSGVVPPQLASLRCELQPPPRRNGETSHSRHVSCGPPRSTTPTSSLSSQLSDPLNTGCEREGTWLRERPTPAGAKRVRPSRCSRYGSGASSDHGHSSLRSCSDPPLPPLVTMTTAPLPGARKLRYSENSQRTV